jgi:uncharacterized membrane protein HdeD (DUF308 family)
LLIGLLGIAAGLLVLKHPLFAAVILPATLVIYLGVLSVVIGIFAIIGGFAGGGIGSFLFGVLNLLIGILLLSSPVAATLAVPFVFGILLLIEGIALIVWAFRVRP